MASTNKKITYGSAKTFEGGIASRISNVEALKRSVMSTLLWENSFYEDGEDIADRIIRLTMLVKEEEAREILKEAKFTSKLRHAPLLMLVAFAKKGWLKKEDVALICTRVDDMPELLSLYWKEGKKPLDRQLIKGLGLAFRKFDEYQLAKYDRDKAIKLRDVLRIARPIPENKEQSALWKKVVTRTLATPYTWETELSKGKDKKEVFTNLIKENKLYDLAFLRNLRNMIEAKVPLPLIKESIKSRKWGWILPYQFITAAKYAPSIESELEEAMLSCLSKIDKLEYSARLLVDVSGSMHAILSDKSELTRIDVASGLAILTRELFPDISIYTFADRVTIMPNRHGFSLRDKIFESPSGGTAMWGAIRDTASREGKKNILIVITDEQTFDSGTYSDANVDTIFIINIANYEHGVGYEKGIVHINGWSENVLEFIRSYMLNVK